VLSLVDLIRQAKGRIAVEEPDVEQGRKPEP
jgi:hypothetical protein